jgi:nicotinate-nucleotide adenylyltransferase
MKTLLAFGGSFDPVHAGHVAMLDAAVAAIKPDITLVIPVGNQWQKGRLPIASVAHRLNMLSLAFPHATIDARELNRAGPTYTVDTLKELARDNPAHVRYWLVGGDSAARLHTWHDAPTLANLATFVVVRRAGERVTPPVGPFCLREIDCDPPPVSSTGIRAARAQGLPIRGMTPDVVCDYIEAHHLYLS